jgi:FtsH-binding integral membrane protein
METRTSKVSVKGINAMAKFVSLGMIAMIFISHLVNPGDYTSKVIFALVGFFTNLVSYFIITKVQKRYVKDKQTKETIGWTAIAFAAISLYLLATKFGIF